MKKILSVLAILMILSLLIVIPAGAEDPSQVPYTARPSVNGRLQVTDSRLADESGNPVILRGISTHGLTWFPQYIDPFIFDQISEDWNCNLIRLAMYSELYCGSQKEESLELLKKGIDAATEADMYVLVDWHILNDSDPNEHINEALGFFREIASEYADHPNLIFEICNEPNGDTNWSAVRSYARQVIPAIREFIPDAVVVVGTPEYDQNLSAPILRPLDFNNVLYCLHFYAASHYKGLQEELRLAVEAKLPVFVSECGISESTGDGAIDFDSAASWFSYLESHGISFAVWSLCDKTESSAIFKHGFDVTRPITDADLSVAGTWVRELIRGKDPASIPAPAGRLDAAEVKDIVTWFTNSLEFRGMSALRFWLLFAAGAVLLVLLTALGIVIAIKRRRNISRTYDQYYQKINALQASGSGSTRNKVSGTFAGHVILIASIIATLIYLSWRVGFSLPLKSGVLAIVSSGILLIVEVLGFIESLVLFLHMIHMKDHPLPAIPKDRYPDVDIFISTYNEPEDLLRRTINGCRHMEYPDLSKVHIWVCDDNHRPSMRALAEEMGVGYFDREDHNGAKAGNLNHAMSLTSAPYIVTFDADMIPKSDFLLKTIPYFVDIEIRNESLPPEERRHLGLLQTPQCFYDPDVFQHALYSEKRVPNEQDFFYRTIEPAKTSTNSVIYGGSNTVLSRKALEDTGGFFTESITEDFATGLLIESKGYLSLAIPEPLASGQTPHTFREHIKQRTRWGRGVIVTGRKLKIFRRHDLFLLQKISYWSSVIYWYSPFKNLIYLIAPLIFAVFAIPVFYCNWLELLVFWLPMYILQDISLRINSQKKISHKWSGIYETSVMPHLLIPILKEFLGMSLTTFKVTDKTRAKQDRKSDWRAMIPFLILIVLSVAGIVRLLLSFNIMNIISVTIILFWILKNLYLLVMAMFLVDGRDDDGEEVKVKDAEFVTILKDGEDSPLGGITTFLTEHSMTVYLDDNEKLDIGDRVSITVNDRRNTAILKGAVTGIHKSRKEQAWTQTIEILDYGDSQYEYWQILYDRIPTLPQTLQKDFGIFRHLWQNIAGRVSRTLQ